MINPIKTVTVYETADGKEFDTLEHAQEWQARLEFEHWYYHGNELEDTNDNFLPTTPLMQWLIDNRAAVLALLNAQRKA